MAANSTIQVHWVACSALKLVVNNGFNLFVHPLLFQLGGLFGTSSTAALHAKPSSRLLTVNDRLTRGE